VASITEIGDENMNTLKKWRNKRYLGMLAAPLMLAGMLAGLGPAAAGTDPDRTLERRVLDRGDEPRPRRPRQQLVRRAGRVRE
jgi:hypothetical protein